MAVLPLEREAERIRYQLPPAGSLGLESAIDPAFWGTEVDLVAFSDHE